MRLKVYKDEKDNIVGYSTQNIEISKNKEIHKVEEVETTESKAEKLINDPKKYKVKEGKVVRNK